MKIQFWGCGNCGHSWREDDVEMPAICPKCKRPPFEKFAAAINARLKENLGTKGQ